MQLVEYLDKDLILPDLTATTKTDVLAELLAPVSVQRPGFDVDRAHRVLLEREQLGTTGIGDGVAIPHGKLDTLDEILLVVGRSCQGVDFDALDFKLCTIFFLVLAPEKAAGIHLRILAHISRLLKAEDFRRRFMEAQGAAGLWQLLSAT